MNFTSEKDFDPQTRARISQHYSNINDKITDEDIMNVRTYIDGATVKSPKRARLEAALPNLKKGETAKIESTESGVAPSWNILKD